ncbi:glycosyltransferase [Nocardia sp. NPDC127579]|uniref:glycosyltransferase n=1 Tax=Nocardia sp. NPDC127579 TaxID=3345402 RepID=UPI00362DA7DC
MRTGDMAAVDPARILVVAFSRSSLGHLMRSIAVAEELLRRGHEVLFACAAETVHIPRGIGLRCATVHEIGPVPPWTQVKGEEGLRQMARGRLASADYLRACLDDECRLIDEFRPDLVVSDMRSTAGVAASMAGVPSVSIHNARLFVFPMSIVQPMIIEKLREMGIAGEHVDKLLGDVVAIPDYAALEPQSVIPAHIAEFMHSTLREIRYVGPLLRRAPAELPGVATLRAELELGGGPQVLITFGGSSSGREFLPRALEALTGTLAHFTVITGPNVSVDDITPLADKLVAAGARVTVHEFSDHSMELIKAVDVAVIHGGHGTTMEAILCGTPVICIPHNGEQHENASRSVRLGTGVIIEHDEIETALPRRLDEMLYGGYAARAAEVAAGFDGVSGVEQFAAYVEQHMLPFKGAVSCE